MCRADFVRMMHEGSEDRQKGEKKGNELMHGGYENIKNSFF